VDLRYRVDHLLGGEGAVELVVELVDRGYELATVLVCDWFFVRFIL